MSLAVPLPGPGKIEVIILIQLVSKKSDRNTCGRFFLLTNYVSENGMIQL